MKSASEAGGCNIQFAVNPEDGELLVVEMNPRVSRSSALASKATGFPIARVGAKLAVGFLLSELPNDITRTTPASFEPVLDYVVTKFPRFAFEKFPETDGVLGVQMQAVGETMAIGRTFRASWQRDCGASRSDAPDGPWASPWPTTGWRATTAQACWRRCASPRRNVRSS